MKPLSLQLSLIFLIANLCGFHAAIASTLPLYGGQSMVDPLKRVLVKRPDQAFAVTDIQKWHYASQPNLVLAQAEHDAFVNVLKQHNIEVIYHDTNMPDHADAIFVHDPVLMTNQGAIILHMGKKLRNGEESAIEKKLNQLGIPTLYRLSPEATAEAGDMLWLDESTLAVGRSFRTNQAGIHELTTALAPLGVHVVTADLPYDQGQEACLHLQSLISLVDKKLAVVYPNLLPVSFMEVLEQKGFDLISVPEDEYLNMGTNILALAPKVAYTIEGNIQTKKLMEAQGVTVYTYKGDEISHKAEGGATCLTRPLLRA